MQKIRRVQLSGIILFVAMNFSLRDIFRIILLCPELFSARYWLSLHVY